MQQGKWNQEASEQVEVEQFATGSRLISQVISPAIRFWLQSQVESVTALQFQIVGSDRQILQGHLPRVTVTAEQAVYQGLHLSSLELIATQIQVNLGQVLRGKPLRLLHSVPVSVAVMLTQADLTASLAAPLLQQALCDVLKMIIGQAAAAEMVVPTLPQQALTQLLTQPFELHQPQLQLEANRLLLLTEVTSAGCADPRLELSTTLQQISGSHLRLADLELRYTMPGQQPNRLPVQPLDLDLGPTVDLHQLSLEPERITCIGQLWIVP
jgi:hypothetical protein